MDKIKKGYGVIVARYQTPEIHPGQRFVIDNVYNDHDNIIFALGVSNAYPDNMDPMDWQTRKLMITSDYPDAIVIAMKDMEHNSDWSEKLDNSISDIIGNKEAILYGSRDSFISSYTGKFPTRELVSPNVELSATTLRIMATQRPLASKDFRLGYIYGIGSKPSSPYLAVDTAIYRPGEVLICMKPWQKKYRWIGGFVENGDKNIKSAAIREAIEETGGTITFDQSSIVFIDDFKIEKDYRYVGRESQVFSNFYFIEISSVDDDELVASDDIQAIKWVKLSELHSVEFVDEHLELKQAFLNYAIKNNLK